MTLPASQRPLGRQSAAPPRPAAGRWTPPGPASRRAPPHALPAPAQKPPGQRTDRDEDHLAHTRIVRH